MRRIAAPKFVEQIDVTTPLRHGWPLQSGASSNRLAISTMRLDGNAMYCELEHDALGSYVLPSRRHAGTTCAHAGSMLAARIENGPAVCCIPAAAVRESRP
jgi:hypothetical protein